MTDHASPRANVTVDWSSRESVRAKLRILRKYKYPPDQQEKAAQLVLSQAETEPPREILEARWCESQGNRTKRTHRI